MFDIYVERFMYFLWVHTPLEAVPVEVTFFALLITATLGLFVIFVSVCTMFPPHKEVS